MTLVTYYKDKNGNVIGYEEIERTDSGAVMTSYYDVNGNHLGFDQDGKRAMTSKRSSQETPKEEPKEESSSSGLGTLLVVGGIALVLTALAGSDDKK